MPTPPAARGFLSAARMVPRPCPPPALRLALQAQVVARGLRRLARALNPACAAPVVRGAGARAVMPRPPRLAARVRAGTQALAQALGPPAAAAGRRRRRRRRLALAALALGALPGLAVRLGRCAPLLPRRQAAGLSLLLCACCTA